MRKTLKSKEMVGLLRGYVKGMILQIDVEKAYNNNKYEAGEALAHIIRTLEKLLKEIRKAESSHAAIHPLADGWYKKSKPTEFRPFKLPEVEPGTVEDLFLSVLTEGDPLFVRYFETQVEHMDFNTWILHKEKGRLRLIRYHEYMENERIRWASRIRRVFNKVEEFCEPLVFENKMSAEECDALLAEEFADLRRKLKKLDDDEERFSRKIKSLEEAENGGESE